MFPIFLQELKDIQNFPRITSIHELLDYAFQWGISHPHSLIFLRMRLITHIFPASFGLITPTRFVDISYLDALKTDMLDYHFPTAFFEHETFHALAEQVHGLVSETVRGFLLTPMQGHGLRCKRVCKGWAYFNQAMNRIQT
jgi:hypothetical protein